MSKLYEDNKNLFALGWVIYNALDSASYTKLERIVPASRQVISKVFNDDLLTAEMDSIIREKMPTPPAALIKEFIKELANDDVPYIELLGLAGYEVEGHQAAVEAGLEDETSSDPDEFSYVGTKSSIVITKGTETRTVKKSHGVFQSVKDALLADDMDTAWTLASPKEAIAKYASGNVEIDGTTLRFKGIAIKNQMVERIMAILNRNGTNYIGHLAAFADKCMENTSFRAVNELLGFMEKNTLPICPDGDFLTYKKVRSNFKDIHSGTFDNSPGQVCEMPRNEVDDNYEQTCSRGLHVCGYSYLSHYGSWSGGGDKVVVCKVNPKDVVSVPRDYNDQKMRTCRYEVMAEIKYGNELKSLFVDDVKAALKM